MRRYFSHAEISPTCVANRGGPIRALEAALRSIEPVYLDLLRRFQQQPDGPGRIVLSVGWDDRQEAAQSVREEELR